MKHVIIDQVEIKRDSDNPRLVSPIRSSFINRLSNDYPTVNLAVCSDPGSGSMTSAIESLLHKKQLVRQQINCKLINTEITRPAPQQRQAPLLRKGLML